MRARATPNPSGAERKSRHQGRINGSSFLIGKMVNSLQESDGQNHSSLLGRKYTNGIWLENG